jgi:hypothetical protein
MFRRAEQKYSSGVAMLVVAMWLAQSATVRPTFGATVWQDAEETTNEPADRLEAYLLDRGMLELLVRQLEQRLASERTSRARTEIAERLASVYARLLSEASDAAEQREWESAASELLRNVPEANTVELRLSLARAAYTRVESVAERFALRMIDEPERVDAITRLTELKSRFASIGADADRRVRELEREEERAPRLEASWLAEALAQARRQRSMAYYLAGWSSYFLAQLSDNATAPASDALRSFGWLLGADRGDEATLDDLPVASLRYEHVARAAVAAASCYALRGQAAVAEQWLSTIEDAEAVPDAVRSQIFARRLTIRADAGDWGGVAALVSERRATEPMSQRDAGYRAATPLNVPNARLLAVHTFEAIDRLDSGAYRDWRIGRLRDIALGDLVIQGQLGHVIDLASRYNTERFGDESFVSLYVRGLTLYQNARDAQNDGEGSDEPTGDPTLAQQYREASELLAHALRTVDAEEFSSARANTMLLIGLAHFYGGQPMGDRDSSFTDAVDSLERAASEFADAERGADALWMAIRALDAQADLSGGDVDNGLTERREALIGRFLREYPADEKAAALIIRLAESESIPAQERLRLLREVPDTNPLRESALRYAASLAYDVYRAASEDDRDFAATQFGQIAEPLIAIDQQRGASGDTAAQRAAVARARQVAEAILSMRVPDLARAERVVEALRRMLVDNFAGAQDAEEEILFRAAQLALVRGDQQDAEQIVDRLRERGGEYADSSVRVFYRDAALAFERALAGDAPESEIVSTGERLLSVGQELLAQVESVGEEDRNVDLEVGIRVRVAGAAQVLHRLQGDDAMLQLAYSQFAKALDAQPRNVDALRGVAELGADAGSPERALEAWRTLLAGLRAGSEQWFEVRTEHLEVLAIVDRERASAVLRQHAVLYPQLGPEPYRTRLRELAGELGVTLSPEADE